MTLACEDANSKVVDVVIVADVDRVGNSLLQIWNLRSEVKFVNAVTAGGSVKFLLAV